MDLLVLERQVQVPGGREQHDVTEMEKKEH